MLNTPEYLYDINLEKAILASILNDNELMSEIIDKIQANDFYLKEHKDLFSAMIDCINDSKPIEIPFIKSKMGSNFKEQILFEILNTNPIIAIETYTKELKEKSVKRQIMTLAKKVPDILSKDMPSQEIVDMISSNIYACIDSRKIGMLRNSRDVVGDVVKHIQELVKNPNSSLIGLETGFRNLDDKIKGFKNGDLIILAARPGMGKTSLSINFINQTLRNNKGVVFFSLEMPAEQIMMRMLSSITSIHLQKILTGTLLDDDELTRLTDACNYMANRKLFIFDGGYINIHQVRTQLRKLKSTHNDISLCVIDYIGLMTSTGSFSERHLQIAEISRGLKLLARELNMPVIALSQLNRGVESRSNKRPMLSDLRESGAIEQDADIILFVYRDDVYKEQEEKEKQKAANKDGKKYDPIIFNNKINESAEIIIGKNRNGPLGHIDITFHKPCSNFKDLITKDIVNE